MVNSSSYISLSDSASSSSSFSDVDQNSISDQQLCFCGNVIQVEEGEEEIGIYCSTNCARQDAMSALLGTPFTPFKRSQIRSEPIISSHKSSKKTIISSSISSTTHYRRMEAMESRDEYPIETIEEAFLTPSSGSTSLYDDACRFEHDEKVQDIITSHVQPSFALQRWMKENGLQLDTKKMEMYEKEYTRQSSEISFHHPLKTTQKRTISLPLSPSLDTSDDDEETQNQRKRQAEIEKEIRELDVELKQKLEQFDKDQAEISLHKIDPIGLFGEEEEEDLLMEFTSPKLDYEAPLGWRRGSKVYSKNFLGLQLSSDEEDLSSHGSNEALDHSSQHLSRIERLHEALGMAIIDENKQVQTLSPANHHHHDHQEFCRIPSALDMAKDLAFMQANFNARQHVLQLSTTSLGEMPQRKSKVKKVTPQVTTTTNNLSNKRSLTNFFQRRPSQNHLETDNSNNTFNKLDRLTKSTSPRFATLKPMPAKQAN